ncbi:hypothetical protein HG537_0C00220 [Torulaspora globosa]|uniref:Cytosolic Fe-S cluster assembly factor NAR1 n=1 Tax=Torulaspora globosa TaxID=48254 RepID=A0A7H9HSM1_9SACH|nr:hypothetical protein HG537_0C00220 [Torulaspora sp. CBS 2947]
MSALLSEEDLNDFISPGLACVKPVEVKNRVKEEPSEFEVGKEPNELEKVSISLQDCLACAGCITSSEEILLSRQSHTVFIDAWRNLGDETSLAVSISPQSRISLANYYGMALDELDLCLANMFKQFFRCRYLVGTQIGRDITISRSNRAIMAARQEPSTAKKPLLSAVCPGFVLYAEKTKPELVPYLLNVKSPQQITGSLLKLSVNEKLYHLAIMPCFDKKLEASRPDSEQEVDCVITPRELVTMFQELDIDLRHYKTQDTTILRSMSPAGWDLALHWSSNEGSSSGGFAFQYIREMHQLHPQARLQILEGKNSDVREYRLVDTTNDHQIASAIELYGFRNIQNMVRTLTQSTKPRHTRLLKNRHKNTTQQDKPQTPSLATTHFIEVMACPGGCINGGGLLQSEPSASAATRKTLLQHLNTRYTGELTLTDPIHTGNQLDQTSIAHNKPFHYEFHPITSRSNDVVSLGNTW